MHILTEVEKIKLRMANDGVLLSMWHRIYKYASNAVASDEETALSIMKTIQAEAHATFDFHTKDKGFGKTWLF